MWPPQSEHGPSRRINGGVHVHMATGGQTPVHHQWYKVRQGCILQHVQVRAARRGNKDATAEDYNVDWRQLISKVTKTAIKPTSNLAKYATTAACTKVRCAYAPACALYVKYGL